MISSLNAEYLAWRSGRFGPAGISPRNDWWQHLSDANLTPTHPEDTVSTPETPGETTILTVRMIDDGSENLRITVESDGLTPAQIVSLMRDATTNLGQAFNAAMSTHTGPMNLPASAP